MVHPGNVLSPANLVISVTPSLPVSSCIVSLVLRDINLGADTVALSVPSMAWMWTLLWCFPCSVLGGVLFDGVHFSMLHHNGSSLVYSLLAGISPSCNWDGVVVVASVSVVLDTPLGVIGCVPFPFVVTFVLFRYAK